MGGAGSGGGGAHWSVMFPPPPPTPPQPSERSHPRPHPRPHLPSLLSPPPLQPPPPHHSILSTSSINNHNSIAINHHLNSNRIPHSNSVNSPHESSRLSYHHYLSPPAHATPAMPHFLPPTEPPLHHQRVPILYSAQTQNVLTIAVPTPQGNSAWSFPVNVIPRVNVTSSRTRGSVVIGGFDPTHHHQQMLNPRIVPPYSSTSNRATGTTNRGVGGVAPQYGNSGGSLRHSSSASAGDNSRAASVLGNAGSGWHARTGQVHPIRSSSSSVAAATRDSQQSMYSHTNLRLFLT